MTPEQANQYLGIQIDGILSPCPSMPNAVCSFYPNAKRHFREPWSYAGSLISAKERLKAIVPTLSRARLVTEEGPYLHFEIAGGFLKSADDLEFLIDAEENNIHFRSAAREGYWDFGVNARRIQKIKELFENIQI